MKDRSERSYREASSHSELVLMLDFELSDQCKQGKYLLKDILFVSSHPLTVLHAGSVNTLDSN